MNGAPRATGRGRLKALIGLYASPEKLWAMIQKAFRVFANEGARALIDLSVRKLERPTHPIEVLQKATGTRCEFEDRWVDVGAGLSHTHSVTALVLTKGNQRLLNACLVSLSRSVDAGALLNLVVVTNGGPVRPPTPYPFPVRVLTEDRRFNWSAYNNRAAAEARTEFLLFLNDDVEALHGGWLDAMLHEAMMPGVGVVGAKLLFPEGTIQHCGIELGPEGATQHRYKFQPRDSAVKASAVQAVDAVTGACFLTYLSLFRELGGFDESFPLDYNDVDYCLRSVQAGKKVSVCLQAELLHGETATRSLTAARSDQQRFLKRWNAELARGHGR